MFPVILSHIVGPSCFWSSLVQMVHVLGSWQSRRIYLLEMGAFVQGHAVDDRSRVHGVRDARSIVIACVIRHAVFTVSAGGFLGSFVCDLHRLAPLLTHWCCGLVRSPVNVVLVQLHSVFDIPVLAIVWGHSFPTISLWDVVHFPLIVQPLCRRIFTS